MGLERPRRSTRDGVPIAGAGGRRVPAERPVTRSAAGQPRAPALPGRRPGRPGGRADRARLAGRPADDRPARPVALRPRGRRPAVPDATHVWLEGGFEPGRLYEVVYRTRDLPGRRDRACSPCATAPPSCATPTAAAGNPCAGRIDHAFAFGVSQSGRFLRHFLSLGLNLDEAGRQVFDGLMPHVAGARRGEFNHRFAQPSAQATPSFGHLLPFTYDDQTDPLTGRRRPAAPPAGARRRAEGHRHQHLRRVLARRRLAAAHRPGRQARPGAAGRRCASTLRRHAARPGALPLTRVSAADGQRGAHGFNAVDYTPLLRAALVNLDRWVSDGVEPPPSAFPRLADGTAPSRRGAAPASARSPASPARSRSASGLRRSTSARTRRGRRALPGPSSASATPPRLGRRRRRQRGGGIRLPDLPVPWRPTPAGTRATPPPAAPGQIIACRARPSPSRPPPPSASAPATAPLDRGALPRPRRLPRARARRRRGAGAGAATCWRRTWTRSSGLAAERYDAFAGARRGAAGAAAAAGG